MYKTIPALLAIPAILVAVQAYMTVRTPDVAPAAAVATTDVVATHSGAMVDPSAWEVFRFSSSETGTAGSTEYRLAGTFFVMGNTGGADENRRAIIDDLANDHQYIVSEGEEFQGYEVLRIYPDKVVLRRDAIETVLDLSFTGTGGAPVEANDRPQAVSDPTETVISESRFGKQVGENRWVLKKDDLRAYYQELLDDPERIANLYLSMKAHVVSNNMTGYRLETEGEGAFFDAMGLRDGDVINRLNSMRMISQRRAEYFLSEFGQDRLGAVVLDIERDGQPQKLIYHLR